MYSSSVYSCHLFLKSSASVRSITLSVLYRAHLCMKCCLGISNFLEEISSLSHSVVFLHFFALIAEEGFLISSCCSLELCITYWIFLCLFILFILLCLWWSFCILVVCGVLFIVEFPHCGWGCIGGLSRFPG